MNLQFHLATPAHQPLLWELMNEFHQEDGETLDPTLAEAALSQLLGDATLGWVEWMTVDTDPVGYIVVALGFSLEFGGRDGLVDEFYIRPSYRRLGIGTQTLHHVFEVAHQKGLRALHLEADPGNQAAYGLYAKLGFQKRRYALMSKYLKAPSIRSRVEPASPDPSVA